MEILYYCQHYNVSIWCSLWGMNWILYKTGNVKNVINIKDIAMEIQQCDPFALLCYKSLSTMLLLWFYVTGNNQTYLVVHVMCPIFLSDFNQIWTFLIVFIKVLNIKFHGNSSNGSQADTWGQMDRHDEANMFSGNYYIFTLAING